MLRIGAQLSPATTRASHLSSQHQRHTSHHWPIRSFHTPEFSGGGSNITIARLAPKRRHSFKVCSRPRPRRSDARADLLIFARSQSALPSQNSRAGVDFTRERARRRCATCDCRHRILSRRAAVTVEEAKQALSRLSCRAAGRAVDVDAIATALRHGDQAARHAS